MVLDGQFPRPNAGHLQIVWKSKRNVAEKKPFAACGRMDFFSASIDGGIAACLEGETGKKRKCGAERIGGNFFRVAALLPTGRLYFFKRRRAHRGPSPRVRGDQVSCAEGASTMSRAAGRDGGPSARRASGRKRSGENAPRRAAAALRPRPRATAVITADPTRSSGCGRRPPGPGSRKEREAARRTCRAPGRRRARRMEESLGNNMRVQEGSRRGRLGTGGAVGVGGPARRPFERSAGVRPRGPTMGPLIPTLHRHRPGISRPP